MDGAVTERLATALGHTTEHDLPPSAIAAARQAVVDTLGVMLAGSKEPVTKAVARLVGGPLVSEGATVVGSGDRVSTAGAALVNGTAAHALDFDDTHAEVRGHPSAPILAASLAVGESLGAGGERILAAHVLGVEVAARIGRSFGDSHARIGFHATSSLGVFGAATASGFLLGLDVEQTMTMFGISASLASGLRANFGTMTKPFQVGSAARCGVEAALLARHGVTANQRVIDGPDSFSTTFSPMGDSQEVDVEDWGNRWAIVDPGLAIKTRPCCNRGSRIADAALEIAVNRAPDSQDVKVIDVRVTSGEVHGEGCLGPMTFVDPSNGLEGRFSIQYVVAAALIDRSLGLASFTDDRVTREDVRDLYSRIRLTSDPDRDRGVPDENFHEVTVVMRDGREFTSRVYFARGDLRGPQPLSSAELEVKFRDCASTILDGRRVDSILQTTRDLGDLADIRTLTSLLTV